MKVEIFIAALFFGAQSAVAQVNTVVTDGSVPFAEGVLKDYVVQADARTICKNPFVIGRYISCKDRVAAAGEVWRVPTRQRVWVETNGVLGGMAVVDGDGVEVCQSPSVWNQFSGSLSYIICDN